MPLPARRFDLLKDRLERFAQTLPGVEEGECRAIHRARVASRRLRELLPVLGFDPDAARKFERGLRKVTKRLGRVRELDVLLPILGELHAASPSGERALQYIAERIRVERDTVQRHTIGKTSVGELERIGRKLDGAAKALEGSDTGLTRRALRWALGARAARRASALRATIDEAGGIYLPERLHAVRLALKKLRYALELSAEADGLKGSPDLRRLKRMQNLLGQLHDRNVLITHIRMEQATMRSSEAAISRDLDVLAMSVENGCRMLHARFIRDRAALLDLCDRLIITRQGRVEHARRAG